MCVYCYPAQEGISQLFLFSFLSYLRLSVAFHASHPHLFIKGEVGKEIHKCSILLKGGLFIGYELAGIEEAGVLLP